MSTAYEPNEASAATAPTTSTATQGIPVEEPTIGRLVADASRDVSSIVRNEIALAKAELSVGVKKIGKGGVMLAVAGGMALFGAIFLLHMLAWLISSLTGWNAWTGYGIVTLLLFIVAAILALVGKKQVQSANVKPERTIVTTKDTIDAVKSSASS